MLNFEDLYLQKLKSCVLESTLLLKSHEKYIEAIQTGLTDKGDCCIDDDLYLQKLEILAETANTIIKDYKKNKMKKNYNFTNEHDLLISELEDFQQELVEITKRKNTDSPKNNRIEKKNKSRNPKKSVIPDDYPLNALKKGNVINQNYLAMPTLGLSSFSRKKDGEIITTTVLFSFENDDGVQFSPKFTEFDRQVLNAVCSYYLYGDKDHVFTSKTIYRLMTGNETINPSPQAIAAVTKSIEKMRRLYHSIDATEELARLGIKDSNGKPIGLKAGDFMLPLTDVEIIYHGHTTNGYWIRSEPLLLLHSRLTGRIYTINTELKDIRRVTGNGEIRESLQSNENRIKIVGYLLLRINVILRDKKKQKTKQEKYCAAKEKNPYLPDYNSNYGKKQTPRIILETIFKETGIELKDRKEKQRLVNYILDCFKYWQAIKYIRYEKIMENDQLVGIEIIPFEESGKIEQKNSTDLPGLN